jgi:hypothetical protein
MAPSSINLRIPCASKKCVFSTSARPDDVCWRTGASWPRGAVEQFVATEGTICSRIETQLTGRRSHE